MSFYGWERGEFILPTAAVAGFRKTLNEGLNAHHDAVRQEAVRLHKQINTRSADKYKTALRTTKDKFYEESRSSGWYGPSEIELRRRAVTSDALRVLQVILWEVEQGKGTIHQPTVADVDKVAPKYTNRSTSWRTEEVFVGLKDRTVTWDVCENNHSVDRARETLLGQLFFKAMNAITWTRGTGGVAIGNDEYNRDSDDLGGGANYETFVYGPIGKASRDRFRYAH